MSSVSRETGPPAIRLDRVTKRFGGVLAVDNVSLEIEEGEFFSLLGPSGCGKTTTLRMLAGFETPDEGLVYLRGKDVTLVQPNKRATNMVFQNYELFPHMTVSNNVAYGLKLKKVPKREITRRVDEMLEAVGVGGLGKRAADQLSGGQQQRVALARALINRPAVLLLDEPLSALDVKLRKRMQLELKSIQETLGTTFVYVTHDQEEALLMSDRVGIMNHGVLLQVATPRTIYEQPADDFVADFVGTLNEITIRIENLDAGRGLVASGDRERIWIDAPGGMSIGQTVRLAVRPEALKITHQDRWDGATDLSYACGIVSDVIYLGPFTQFLIESERLGRVVSQQVSDAGAAAIQPGMQVVVSWHPDTAFMLAGPASEGR